MRALAGDTAAAGAIGSRNGRAGFAAVARLGDRAGGRDRESAGLPEQEELFEAGEDAREDGGDQGMQGGGQNPGVSVGGGGGGAQASELVGQWDVCFHWNYY